MNYSADPKWPENILDYRKHADMSFHSGSPILTVNICELQKTN